MDSHRLVTLLGHHADDPLVEAVFVEMRTRRRPELDPTDRDAVRDWVLVRREGVELGFVDEAYFEAALRWRRRRKGVPLLLEQVYFYTARDDVADFTGALPFGVTWRDDRAEARRKLLKYEATRRSYVTDTWDVPGYRMTVEYKDGDTAIASVLCQLLVKPWPEKGRIQPKLSVTDWLSLFGIAQKSPVLRRQLRPLDLAERIKEGEDDGEVEFTFECGLHLYFTEAKTLTRVRASSRVKRTDLVLGAVQFYRARELDAREWKGELPVGLSFDDTQETMIGRVGRSPDEREDDRFSGVARWHFPDLSLEVLYNNIENHLLRITLMAPGFWSRH